MTPDAFRRHLADLGATYRSSLQQKENRLRKLTDAFAQAEAGSGQMKPLYQELRSMAVAAATFNLRQVAAMAKRAADFLEPFLIVARLPSHAKMTEFRAVISELLLLMDASARWTGAPRVACADD